MEKAETIICGGCGKAFTKTIESLGLAKTENVCDIAVIGEHGKRIISSNAKIVFCPEDIHLDFPCMYAVSAGMGEKATLGFSSIGYDSAMLAVNREIDFFGKKVLPGEFKVKVKPSFSLYENMVYGFLNNFL